MFEGAGSMSGKTKGAAAQFCSKTENESCIFPLRTSRAEFVFVQSV